MAVVDRGGLKEGIDQQLVEETGAGAVVEITPQKDEVGATDGVDAGDAESSCIVEQSMLSRVDAERPDHDAPNPRPVTAPTHDGDRTWPGAGAPGQGLATILPMLAAILAAAPVWHYWIGLVLLLATGLLLLAVIVGYLVRVQAPQYPKRRKG